MDRDTVRCILLGAVILCGIGLIFILAPNAHFMSDVMHAAGAR